MNSPLWRLELLGGLRLQRFLEDGAAPIERFRTQKVAALLAYLAYRRVPHSREALCEMFWTENEPSSARNNLRVSLSSLRGVLEPGGTPPGSVLLLSLDTVALAPSLQTDIEAFNAAVLGVKQAEGNRERRSALEEVFELYGGPLLNGYYSEWIVGEADRLEDVFIVHLRSLLAHLEADKESELALDVARRAVALAPTREEVLREVMRLGLQNGQHSAVLREFEAWQKSALKRGASIGAATLELLRVARNLAPAPKRSPLVPLPIKTPKGAPPIRKLGRSLPTAWTTFFGRESELTALTDWLSKPSTRLITLTGPGGIGKTRLALELARQLTKAPYLGENTRFSLIEWVPLADLAAANLIPGAILDALHAPRGAEEIEDLIVALREGLDDAPETRLLLVLDNFEHLGAEGVPLVRALLEGVPELVCLITSRRRLNFEGEREWPLQTLETPSLETLSGKPWVGFEMLAPSSVRLFLDRARRARPSFELTISNADAISQLCARLDGLPLTLELAAARIALFSPAQILAGLDHQLEGHIVENNGLGHNGVSLHGIALNGVALNGVAHPTVPALEVVPLLAPTPLDWTNLDHAAPVRHRSLRAAISWSERQLPPAAARFWTRLSVFAAVGPSMPPPSCAKSPMRRLWYWLCAMSR